MKKNQLNTVIFFTSLLIAIGCNKKFDEPPVYQMPDIHPNISIRDLRALHVNGQFEYFTRDYIIEGIVVANDKSDNFYKSIVLQDSTGGITIRLDAYGLYNDYPIGRRVAVKLTDLWMGDYARMIQLGAGIDNSNPGYPELVALPLPLFNRHLIKKSLNNNIVPQHFRLDQLNDSLQSCLITINNVEFSISDTGTTYADAINKLSDNKTIKSCSGGSAYIRTSGFAGFAAAKTPRGNGNITAVYSVFRTDKQLLIRDTADVQLTGLRCTGPGAKLLFQEDFERGSAGSTLSLTGWKNITEAGGKLFVVKTALNNQYAEISAFATNQSAVASWLILPPVNLSNSANEILSFVTKDGFDNGGVLQVLVSTNYDGGNTPWKAKWVSLKAAVAKGSVSAIAGDWTSSGKVSLNGLQGPVYIAFRYDGADPVSQFDKRTTTFQVDNVRIEGN